MDDDRRDRYLDKLGLLRERIEDVRQWTSGASEETLRADKKTRLASYKALQEMIEAAMDLCAMRLVDAGTPPKDDYDNIRRLEERADLTPASAVLLREANGLRNRLVHAYNNIEDRRILEFVAARLDSMSALSVQVETWLS